MDILTLLDIDKEKCYTYAEELKKIVNKINEIIPVVNAGGGSEGQAIAELQEAVSNLQDLFNIAGKAKKAVEADTAVYATSAGSVEGLSPEDIQAILGLSSAVSGLQTAVENLEQLFSYGKAKKALEALKLKYEGNIDASIEFNAVAGEWQVKGNARQFNCDYIYSININGMDDDIIVLKGYFNNGKAISSEVADYLQGDATHLIVWDNTNNRWSIGGTIWSPSEDAYFGEVNCSVITLTDLDTSDPHVAGQVWNDSGTVKISNG